jgi:O-antigen ligase
MKNNIFQKIDLNKFYQYLLITLAFLTPMTVFGANLIIVVITLTWLLSGNYKNKFNEIIKSNLMVASLVFFGLHVIGLIWTNDLLWGLHIVHKMWYFLLLFPIFFTLVQKKYIEYYILAFLSAILLSVTLSYLIWFEIMPLKKNIDGVEMFLHATLLNPIPFMSHISYNPILCIAIYIVLQKIIFNIGLTLYKKFAYYFFAIIMIINMFITAGRAGQVMFFAMLGILFIQTLVAKKYKFVFLILILIPGIFITAYQVSPAFTERVDDTISSITNYSQNSVTALGHRITYWVNTLELIQEHPIIGVGTGDFPEEYNKIHSQKSNTPSTTNPHNMYLLVQAQLGIIGLLSFLSIFYYQIKLSFLSTEKFYRDLGIALPLLFLVAMFSDSYLLGHFTSLIFIFFSSFLYKNFEET